MRPFRQFHLETFIADWTDKGGPLDVALSAYFKKHKALGPKDRSEIYENVYHLTRWKLLPEGSTFHDKNLPLNVRVSAPEELWNAVARSYGDVKAFDLLLECNYQAPVTIRVNPNKISRDELFKKWKTTYDISVTKHSQHGIKFHKRVPLFTTPEFKEGMFEIQDEGSQLAADLVNPKPGDAILDWCAGSGGKTLAFGYKTLGKGQIYLHDIRRSILVEAKKRLRRAGLENVQFIYPEEEKKMDKIKKKMDWVIVDAPCTGTGTLRRNPEMKYQFTEERLRRFVGEQRKIFEKALSFLKPDGKIVWITCSILKEENEEQVAHFIKTYDLEIVGKPFQSLPERDEMDGLSAFVLTRKSIK